MAGIRGSWWSISINNPTPDDRAALKSPPKFVLDLFYQDEIGEKCGTLHIQGCVHTIYSRMAAIKEWLPRSHIEKARKPPGALKNYVHKSKTAVPDTYNEFHANATDAEINEIIEANNQQLGFLEALRMIAAAAVLPVDAQDQNNFAETMYKGALSTLFTHKPELLQGLTGARIFPAFKLIWENLLSESAEIHQHLDYPTDDDDSPAKEWKGLPECQCEKDECEICV